MRTLLIIVLLAIVVFVVLQYTNPRAARNTETAVKQATKEVTEKAKEGVNDLKQKAQEERIPEKIKEGSKKVENLALDASITAAVKAKLADDELVKARNIDVDTKDGHVTLSGYVSSTTEADRAIELAQQAEGVKSVSSRLIVKAA
ncbi:MAG TPA: BON domain-containing protein [Acidobacteriota bacterium]|nr:BON domain-containing protein [Acidobacteriota bacterium]